jgi:hypothetical protein
MLSVFDERTTVAQTGERRKPGVWFFGAKSQGDPVVLTSNWICPPLHITAVRPNDQGQRLRPPATFREHRLQVCE